MIGRLATYAWAGPNTLLGLLIGALMMLFGARVRCVAGVIEFAARTPGALREGAMTLGHVVLGTDQATLETWRAHERVHVRQYESWGPLFLPAYAASSLWQLLRGRRCYRDNWFEREAYERS